MKLDWTFYGLMHFLAPNEHVEAEKTTMVTTDYYVKKLQTKLIPGIPPFR